MNTDIIPSIDECYELMKSEKMLPNIIEHSKQVMRVAVAIVENLKDEVRINSSLIIAASLLHDITKTISLKTKEPHDITGGKFLRELGFFSTANIVEQHVYLKTFQPDGGMEEREIVNYADKRVMHNKIVSIEQRIDDLVLRYGNTSTKREIILRNKDSIFKLGKKINSFMKRDINTVISEIRD